MVCWQGQAPEAPAVLQVVPWSYARGCHALLEGDASGVHGQTQSADYGVPAGALRQWRSDGLKHFPELHFTYEEESSPEDFFVPYVWTLTVTNTTIPWNNQNISLFAPVDPADDVSLQGRDSQTGSQLSQLDVRLSLADEA